MSKTFKSDNELAKTISITRSQGRVLVEIEDPKHLIAINLSDNNAPALALAILEAAGVEPVSGWIKAPLMGSPEQLAVIAQKLVLWIEASESHSKAQAELEAEALELANAAVIECGNPPYPSVERMGEKVLRRWLAVARKAREMRAEK